MNCLFCKIAKREIPADVVYEDSHLVAFRDIRPVAPTHVLLIPRQHVSSLAETTESYTQTLGLLLAGSAHVAAQLGLAADGYRTVINTGANGGQTVFHLHVHVLGGRLLGWPPG